MTYECDPPADTEEASGPVEKTMGLKDATGLEATPIEIVPDPCPSLPLAALPQQNTVPTSKTTQE